MATTSNLTMKLLIDTKNQRVLFAEAGKDVVDFLFSVLSLPIGSVVRLLKEQGMVGTLGNFYQSIEELNETYMQPNLDKDTLLKLKVSFSVTNIPLLLPYVALYRCSMQGYVDCHKYVAVDKTAVCPYCMNIMSSEAVYVDPTKKGSSSGGGGFVKEVVMYMIMDDLVVKPMSTISCLAMLNKFNIEDVGVLVEKQVDLSTTKVLKLLKASLLTKTVLTSVFLGRQGNILLHALKVGFDLCRIYEVLLAQILDDFTG